MLNLLRCLSIPSFLTMSTLPRMMLPNHGRVSSIMVLPARVLHGCQMGRGSEWSGCREWECRGRAGERNAGFRIGVING